MKPVLAVFDWMETKMRTKNSIKNILISWGTQVIKIIAGFVARTIFIQYLSMEYLGLTSTFSNILQILSFAELGIGAAIAVEMYKPIAENNYEEQIILFQYYKKVFRVIGLIILIGGGMLTPFLDLFVKELPDLPYVHFIYLLLVINSAGSYFMGHKSTYFSVRQKNYVVRIAHSALYIAMLALQSITLIITGNYILYFAIPIFTTLGENIVYSRLLKKEYPFLSKKTPKKMGKDEKNKILENIRAVVYFKIGNVIVTSTDNLVLAKMIGVVAAGIYSNYYMVITAMDSVLAQIFSSTVASIGDLHVASEEHKQKDVFEKMMFLSFFLYALVTVVMMSCINDFIRIWLGNDFMFSTYVVDILGVAFFVKGYRNVLGVFREACGLYRHLRFVTISEAIANLIISVVLTRLMGIAGIFLGTIASFLLFGFWKEPCVLYKQVFHTSVRSYWKKFLIYMGIGVMILGITYWCGNLMHPNSYLTLICKILFVTIVAGVLFIICVFWMPEFQYFKRRFKIFD